MTYLEIKKLVERVTGIEDIAAKSRKRYIADARFVYYKLCMKYVSIPFSVTNSEHKRMMAETLNRDRTTVIHALSEFDALDRSKTWWGSWAFKVCVNTLRGEKRRKLNGAWEAPVIEIPNCLETEFVIIK